MGRQCEQQPPTLEHFDAWGRRVDNIQTCEGWGQLHDVSAEEGLISIAFERKYGQWRYISSDTCTTRPQVEKWPVFEFFFVS